MTNKHKMAIGGAGMVAAGIGLSVVGTALIAPAVFSFAARIVEKGAEALGVEIESASRTVGTAAGTLRRSFNEAARAGVAEMRRGNSKARNVG